MKPLLPCRRESQHLFTCQQERQPFSIPLAHISRLSLSLSLSLSPNRLSHPTHVSPYLPCPRVLTHSASIDRLLCEQCNNLSATRSQYIPPSFLLPQHPASSRNEHLSGISQTPNPRGIERTRVHLITLRAHLLVLFVFCFEFYDGFLWRASASVSPRHVAFFVCRRLGCLA
jgi:hypothetical protein